MRKKLTLFAMLLRLLGARPRDVCEAVSADKSLVSRWCNGKQKLMPGHGWVEKVADYLLMLDGRLRVLRTLKKRREPVEQQGRKKLHVTMLHHMELFVFPFTWRKSFFSSYFFMAHCHWSGRLLFCMVYVCN